MAQEPKKTKAAMEVRFRSSEACALESTQRFADLLHALTDFRRADEAQGHRYLDENGRTLQTLEHEN